MSGQGRGHLGSYFPGSVPCAQPPRYSRGSCSYGLREPLLLQLAAIFALLSDTGLAGKQSRAIEVSPQISKKSLGSGNVWWDEGPCTMMSLRGANSSKFIWAACKQQSQMAGLPKPTAAYNTLQKTDTEQQALMFALLGFDLALCHTFPTFYVLEFYVYCVPLSV